jgi:hypothetical protein
MSDLRVIYNQKAFESILDILSTLKSIQNNKRYEIRGWNKRLLGYGLKQTEFDKLEDSKTTERQFRTYKMDLLDYRFIEIYDKNKRVKGRDRYSITPIGLLFLYKYRHDSAYDLFDYFKRITFNREFKIEKKSWKFFRESQINKSMNLLFKYLEFDYEERKLTVTLDAFIPKTFFRITLTQAVIDPRFIKITKPLKTNDKIREYVKFKELSWGIAWYVRNLLFYYMYINTKKSMINKIPVEFRNPIIIILKQIEHESLTNFVENSKKEIQAYGDDSPKLISILTKNKLQRFTEDLD